MDQKQSTIVILGPQGSGKGTQAAILATRFGLQHIDMGELLRHFATSRHPLAHKVKKIMNTGSGLVPSALVIDILAKKVQSTPTDTGILFDGFPRNITQARALDRILRSSDRSIAHVIYLPISQKTTIARLSKRHREDDTPQAIAHRLATYKKKTRPVIDHYRQQGVLRTINGEPAVPIVTKRILEKIHA